MDLESAVRAAAGGHLDAFAEITRRFQHMAFGYALCTTPCRRTRAAPR
jgi:hypothetical protein